MIIRYFLALLLLLGIGFFPITNSYSNELAFLDEWQTIKELKADINTLDKASDELDDDLKTLNTDYELKTFLKTNLGLIELNKIRKLVYEYNSNNARIELELFRKAKELLSVIEERKLLLEEKRKFYSWLIPYIDIIFREQYLEYIKLDAKIFNEQKEVSTDIVAKQEILINKVETIESKIREHRDFINENIRRVIETRLDEKIESLNTNESFIALSLDSKIKVLDKTIVKVKIKLKNLVTSNDISFTWAIIEINQDVLNKKIQTFNIAVEKLELFKNSLK